MVGTSVGRRHLAGWCWCGGVGGGLASRLGVGGGSVGSSRGSAGEFLRLLSPGACTTWALGVWAWIWAWIWAQRGGWGIWWGLGGVFAGALGGEGVADKEEREGRCTSIGLHLETDLTPSVVNFVRSCLVSCTRAARVTREAPATKTKRTKFGVSGENATGMFE